MFHIIDDWYLVADTYSWMVARKAGESKIRGSSESYPNWKDQIYMDTPDKALTTFARDYVRLKAAKNGVTGELKDLAIFLSSEYSSLASRIEEAFSWATERRGTSE